MAAQSLHNLATYRKAKTRTASLGLIGNPRELFKDHLLVANLNARTIINEINNMLSSDQTNFDLQHR